MKTPWWFRLYTLHTLKFFAKVTAAQFVIYYILDALGGTFAQMAGLVILIAPISYMMSHDSSHFRTNIEFHKMSIPFPELKRAFFFDIAVKQIVFAGLFLLNLYIAIRVSGGMKLAGEFMILTPSQLLYFVPMYFLGTASAMTFYKESKYLFIKKHRLAIVNLGLFTATITFVGLLFSALSEIGYTFPLIAAFGVSAVTTGILLFRSKAIFHQFRPVGRIRDAALFTGYGTAICLAFYFVAVFVGRNDVLSTEYSGNQRASSLTFSGPFAPQIDKETFVAIERALSSEDYPLLYKKADFPVASLGLEYFLDNDPHCIRLKSMLAYTRPEPTFLSALYDHFENNPDYWKEKWGGMTLKAYAYSRWPSKTMPEKYEVIKVAIQNEMEEIKKQKARKREIASKKRSR